MPFDELEKHDSTPSVPLTDVQQMRWSEIAEDLRDARIQAYVEANFGIQALKVLQTIIPILAGLV